MIVNQAGLGILDVLDRFENFFRVGNFDGTKYLLFFGWLDLSKTVHSPLFCRETVEIERVLTLMAAILIFKCTERVGVGDYSSRGRGARNLQTAPPPK